MRGRCRQTKVLNICLYKVYKPESIFFGLSMFSFSNVNISISLQVFSHWEIQS